jgi:hypothetical protein
MFAGLANASLEEVPALAHALMDGKLRGRNLITNLLGQRTSKLVKYQNGNHG